ncbi:hypothetical protein TRFO_04528 [Tritrichomonas foetus]|uniref:Uncharacterized protein n=1 Tax=Tritrichomonas foetus TaxID=1144522 RepID=A0A1J4KJD8_9EUKA|nr:hypothetical protein TRFO_04528 [Tritrichomonas foetus]|eukprot:OHT09461.1 hypothetical protein TRFO_04528 [Tritrichomonas foetus]
MISSSSSSSKLIVGLPPIFNVSSSSSDLFVAFNSRMISSSSSSSKLIVGLPPIFNVSSSSFSSPIILTSFRSITMSRSTHSSSNPSSSSSSNM